MQAALFHFGLPCLEIFSHIQITQSGILERCFERAAAEIETLRCDVEPDFLTGITWPCSFELLDWFCMGLCNCVQWTWNRAMNKRPVCRFLPHLWKAAWPHLAFFFQGLMLQADQMKEKPKFIWLGRVSGPPGDEIKHKVTFLVIALVGRWWVKLLRGGVVTLGSNWKAQTIGLPLQTGEECAHWSPVLWTLSWGWSKRISD